uniref:Uncharacterized protein n=1 Tax=Tanacetum cinerariifolium TaxID=118510 RepID=A0A699GKT8_TANCI|nr:hypothetical protein [Tanacetum cinerariifolium]
MPSPKHPQQYNEYLVEFWYTTKILPRTNKVWFSTPTRSTKGEVGVNSFRNFIGENHLLTQEISNKDAMIIYCLANGVIIDFVKLIWDDLISKLKKKNKDKCQQLGTEENQPEGPPFTDHMLAIWSTNEPMAFQAPKTTRQADKFEPKGTNPEAKTGRRKKSTPLTMNSHLSKLEATKSSTIIHFKSASGNDASADFIAEADLEKSAPKDLLSQQQDKTKSAGDGLDTVQTRTGTKKEANNEQEFDTSHEFTTSSNEVNKEIKVEDLSELVKNISLEAIDLDTLEDDQYFMVLSDKEEEVHDKPNVETKVTSTPTPPSPKSIKIQELSTQLTKLLVKSLKHELSQLLTDHDFSTSIITELKEIPSKVNDLHRVVKDIKKYMEDLEIKVLGDSKELLEKLEEFQSSLSALTSKIATLEHINPPKTTPQPEEEQVKDKGSLVESLEQKPLKKFVYINEKGETFQMTKEEIKNQKGIVHAIKADAKKYEIKKAKQDLIDLVGLDAVEKMYMDKVKYDVYCLKMLNGRAKGKIKNYNALLKGNGPITLKFYRLDGSEEIIQKFKASDLHLGEIEGNDGGLS